MIHDPQPMEDFSIWAAAQGGEPFDPDLLEELVTDLVHMTTQKTAGQRKDKPKDLSFENLERIRMGILAEATMLVMQGGMDIIRAALKEANTNDLRLCPRQHAGTK